MAQPPRPRAPEDREPPDTPVYPEADAIRYELPVVVAGVKGTLVIRVFEHEGRFARGPMAVKDDVESSIRGDAAALLDRIKRKP